MNIDETSGRSLDALVAQHVFGLQVEPEALYRLPSGDLVRVPYYSSLILGADEVVARLQDLGWRVMGERRAKSRGAPPVPRILLTHSDGRIVSATGKSFSEAMCRAGLKAVCFPKGP